MTDPNTSSISTQDIFPSHPKERKRTKSEIHLSKFLSLILRHSAPSLGLPLSSDGYVPLGHLRHCPQLRLTHVTEEELTFLVESDPKQRFKLSHKKVISNSVLERYTFDAKGIDTLCIRANQGHSINVNNEELLTKLSSNELSSIPVIVHGTTRAAWQDIQHTGGLHKMKRNHIHCANAVPCFEETPKDEPTKRHIQNVLSGMRSSCTVYIYIDGKKCAKDGIVFYQSDNGVLLTSGRGQEGMLTMEYFQRVVDAETQKELI